MTSNLGVFGVDLPPNSYLRYELALDNAYYRTLREPDNSAYRALTRHLITDDEQGLTGRVKPQTLGTKTLPEVW